MRFLYCKSGELAKAATTKLDSLFTNGAGKREPLLVILFLKKHFLKVDFMDITVKDG